MADATLAGVAKMRDNPVGADLIIICEGKQIKAHQHFVCSHSTVLAQKCSSQISAEGIISLEINNFDAETVGHTLDFIYKGDYVHSKTTDGSDNATAAELTVHLYVHSIAEVFDVALLRELAKGRFISASNANVSRVSRLSIRDIALDRITELCDDEYFVNVLGTGQDLNGFSANILRRVVQAHEETLAGRLREMSRKLEQCTSEAKSWEEQAAKHAKTLRMGERAHKAAMSEITHLRSTLNGNIASDKELEVVRQGLATSQAKEKELAARVLALETIAQDRDSQIQKIVDQDAAVQTLHATLATKTVTIESQKVEIATWKKQTEAKEAAALSGNVGAQSAERKRYIIERIKHLSGFLDRCHNCHNYFNGKVVKQPGDDEPVEKELSICCRNCNWRHIPTDYIGGG